MIWKLSRKNRTSEIGVWIDSVTEMPDDFTARIATVIAEDIDFHIDGRLAALSDEYKCLWPDEIGNVRVDILSVGAEGVQLRASATIKPSASDLSRQAYIGALTDYLEDLAASRPAVDGETPMPETRFGNATAKLLRDHETRGGRAEFVGPKGRREAFGFSTPGS